MRACTFQLPILVILFLNLGTVLSSSAKCGCPHSPPPPPKGKPPTQPPATPPAPVKPPTRPPITPPVRPPTQPPVTPPVKPPTKPPITPPVKPPTKPPITPPVRPPTQPPVTPPVKPPTKPPITPPVKPPTQPPSPPPSPVRSPPPPPPRQPSCPINTGSLDACVNLLGRPVNVVIGSGVKQNCCPPIAGLSNIDAAVCFCGAVKAKYLDQFGIIFSVALKVLDACGKTIPPGFQCPA